MKYLFPLLFCISNCVNAQKTNSNFSISGIIGGLDSGIVSLSYLGLNNKYIEDSAILKNGKFFFKGVIATPTVAYIKGNTKSIYVDDLNSTEFFLEPKLINIKLEVDNFKQAVVAGSKTQNEYIYLKKEKASIEAEMLPLEKELQANMDLREKDKNNKALIDKDYAIREKFIPYRTRERNIDYQFIATHPNSYLSPYRLMFNLSYLPLDSIKMFYNRFNPAIKKSSFSKVVSALINGSPGGIATNFTAVDSKNNTISLATFKGNNYVLLDFWATWCVPCRGNSPHLIELYNKYHSKGLEIIGIANDDKRIDAWRKAIIDDKTDVFHQVLQGVGTKNDIGKEFGIQPIPTKILIDKNGKIIYRYENDDDSLLDKKLAEIFKQ